MVAVGGEFVWGFVPWHSQGDLLSGWRCFSEETQSFPTPGSPTGSFKGFLIQQELILLNGAVLTLSHGRNFLLF